MIHRETPAVELRVDAPGERLDAFLAARLPDLSRSRIQVLIREQYIIVNHQPAKPRDAVKTGDVISIAIPEAVPLDAAPQDIPLEILFEDDDLVVLNKAPGMVVHPAPGNPDGTLVNALLHHCKGKLSGIGGVERPGIVHRLDKETSGLIVIAKSDRAHQALAAQFTNRTLTKVYLALVSGVPATAAGDWCGAIGRHPVHRHRMAVRPDGRQALSHWQMLAADPARNFSRFAVTIATGRTHQIRVHAAHAGHPLCGDPTYGYRPLAGQPPFPRVMLHAWSLTLAHPLTGKQVKLEAQPPADFAV
jgi:23S rRNA pseudouridine1911/1915/1917 synthase